LSEDFTYIQNNSVFYPADMPSVCLCLLARRFTQSVNYVSYRCPPLQHLARSKILGLTIFHCIVFILYLPISISYWLPATMLYVTGFAKFTDAFEHLIFLPMLMALAALVEFAVNFGISVDGVGIYNSIDNFYDAAPCDQNRPLKSGILLVAETGKMYPMMWVSLQHSYNTAEA
jgi:hypothetical protein